MSEPKLPELDEPSLGLAPIVFREIGRTLRRLGEGDLTVLLVEQNAKLDLQRGRSHLHSRERPHATSRCGATHPSQPGGPGIFDLSSGVVVTTPRIKLHNSRFSAASSSLTIRRISRSGWFLGIRSSRST